MVFSSFVFLFIFLPAIVLIYYCIRQELQNLVLLSASLFFYAWGEPLYVFIMILSIIVNYITGRLLENNSSKYRRLILGISIVYNLGMLVVFKYLDFIIENINKIVNSLGIQIEYANLTLPIGISFFTFQAMSYIIDVYRKDVDVQKSILKLGLYISLFPQLIAGPIVRYHDIAKQMDKRKVTLDNFYIGIKRFIIGLAKKILIANTLGQVADEIFATDYGNLTMVISWLGIIAYSLQIYYDFSGYSDMAIGLGKLFGFDFLENFNYPYISTSIKEFWRRWHISLSSWFRDYVYIPLGGNRGGESKTIRNLIIVFFLTGLWHGASWNFIIWGLFHGALLLLERTKFFSNWLTKGWTPFARLYVLFSVALSWVFFRTDNLSLSFNYVKAMFSFNNSSEFYQVSQFISKESIFIFVVGIIFSAPTFTYLEKKLVFFKGNVVINFIDIFLIGIFLLSIMKLSGSSYNPFIYFRF